jgi:pre-mRNA-splicing factor RBM22/SLT11
MCFLYYALCVQVCLFDLDYGLPVQVRDTALGIEKEEIPESDVGKEFQLNERIQQGETESSYNQSRPNDILLQLQRTTPYYKVRIGAVQSAVSKEGS